MPKFRKKPIVIDAEQWEGDNLTRAASMFQTPEVIIKSDGLEFIVGTLEGTMTGRMGDWLIRGVKGEHYPCKDEIFRATYEPANPP